jgi:N-acetylglucosaminyl-diphospho-decaprenol L-rhamnosyltransferase
MAVKVSVLIVNYNTRELLDQCLESIKAETRCSHELIVVDNASSDGSAAMIRRKHPGVTVIENGRNLGFARANNQASRAAHGGHLMLLNPDTVILDAAIDRLVEYMDAHTDVGACGPRIIDSTGTVVRSCYRIPAFRAAVLASLSYTPLRPLVTPRRTESTCLEGDRVQDVEAIQGCSLLVRAGLFRKLGGFDESFFLYVEDIDLCHRLHLAGYRVVYMPQATIVHYGATSAEAAQAVMIGDRIGSYYLRSRYHFLHKTQGTWASAGLRMTDLLVGTALLIGGTLHPDVAKRTRFRALGRLLCLTALALAHTPRAGTDSQT